MCLGGGSVAQVAPPPTVIQPPPQPAPAAPAMAGPTISTIPSEEKAQKKVKNYAQNRRARSGGITGKKTFTIPLNSGSGTGVNP